MQFKAGDKHDKEQWVVEIEKTVASGKRISDSVLDIYDDCAISSGEEGSDENYEKTQPRIDSFPLPVGASHDVMSNLLPKTADSFADRFKKQVPTDLPTKDENETLDDDVVKYDVPVTRKQSQQEHNEPQSPDVLRPNNISAEIQIQKVPSEDTSPDPFFDHYRASIMTRSQGGDSFFDDYGGSTSNLAQPNESEDDDNLPPPPKEDELPPTEDELNVTFAFNEASSFSGISPIGKERQQSAPPSSLPPPPPSIPKPSGKPTLPQNKPPPPILPTPPPPTTLPTPAAVSTAANTVKPKAGSFKKFNIAKEIIQPATHTSPALSPITPAKMTSNKPKNGKEKEIKVDKKVEAGWGDVASMIGSKPALKKLSDTRNRR